ncbi:MAG: response regulator, partial [Pseudomonadota bacterium]
MTFTHAALDADGSSPTTMPVLADSQPVQVEIVDEAIVVTPFPAAPAEGSGADAADNESQLMGDPAQITRAEPEILTPVSSELVEMLTPDVAVATEGADEVPMAIEPVFCEAKVGIPLDAPSQAATASNELMLTPTSTSTSKREAQEIVHTQDDILPCADDDGFELPAASVGAVSNAVTPPHAVAPDAERQIPILIAEDDPDDRMFMRDAFDESDFEHEIAFVENGEELLSYLKGEGEYASAPRPGLILLDLNMPKMDGRTALLHIKANPSLRRIPVIVLTTSRAEEDIEQTYDLGVSSYISKPSSADGLKEVIATLNGYWSNLVALPNRA